MDEQTHETLDHLTQRAKATAILLDGVRRGADADLIRDLVAALVLTDSLWEVECGRSKRYRYERNTARRQVAIHAAVITRVRDLLLEVVNRDGRHTDETDVVELARGLGRPG